MSRARNRDWSPRWFCPTHMDGFHMMRVEFSVRRTLDEQPDGTWKAEAPVFGLVANGPGPLDADRALTRLVEAAVAKFAAAPTREPQQPTGEPTP